MVQVGKSEMITLLNKELDGTLLPAEAAQLKSILAASEEARSLQADLHTLKATLASADQAVAPPSLLPGVMRRIEQHENRSVRHSPSSKGLFDSFRVRKLRISLAFAGGMAFGILGFILASQLYLVPEVSEGEIAGTIVYHERTDGMEGFKITPLSAEGVQGNFFTRTTDSQIIVGFDVTCPDSCSAAFTFDPSLGAIETVRPLDGFTGSLTVDPGIVTVRAGTHARVELTVNRSTSGRLTLQTHISRMKTRLVSTTAFIE